MEETGEGERAGAMDGAKVGERAGALEGAKVGERAGAMDGTMAVDGTGALPVKLKPRVAINNKKLTGRNLPATVLNAFICVCFKRIFQNPAKLSNAVRMTAEGGGRNGQSFPKIVPVCGDSVRSFSRGWIEDRSK